MSPRRHSTSGWAGGINAYAVVLLLGVFGAAGLSDDVPGTLQRGPAPLAAPTGLTA
ncbi:hypothetical protein ABZ725_39030 [Streptomyces sp. NPDC006872]|uniref:hypothetical protein n=1 Tax=Streptomyces sp. NPDC006872 TaxID=3155720 RepID=UPI0033F3158B